MPVTLKLINFDTIYNRIKSPKILINHEDIFNTENKEKLDSIILKNYSEDNLSIIPSCNCGDLKGAYYIGEVCHKCGTHVSSNLDDNISFLLWAAKPQEVEQFISPQVLNILLNRYKITKPNVPLIKYIMLPNFKFDKRAQKKNMHLLEKLDFLLEQNNIKRGYNSFVQNFFKIIEILETEFVKEKPSIDEFNFYEFLMRNRDRIFSNFLPFPNRIIFAMESNELGKFIDKSLLNPINVIRRLTGIDLYTKPPAVKQAKVANSLIDLSEFYASYMKNVMFSKPGLNRQHIASTRCHFTARAVISSIYGPHESDEIRIPWSIACTLLREHILNRLYVRKYTYKQATNFLQYHNRIYTPILDEIFKEIIAAGGGDGVFHTTGLLCLFNRNPSLHRGSIQTVRITQVKTDTGDNTISMSYLIGPSFNSDYDGDELNLSLVLTEKVRRNLCNFEPHHNILTLGSPNEFSSNIKLPKTLISTLSNWLMS